MIYEIQHELPGGDWQALGISRTADDRLDLQEAVSAMRATHPVPRGTVRIRELVPGSPWHFGELDETGRFRSLDA